MTSKVLDIQVLRDQVRQHLPSYLASRGIDLNDKGTFKCFVHDDSSPSAHIWNGVMWKCFGCGASGDVLDACAALEGKAASGPAWVTDNLLYLATEFGIPTPDIELNPEEQRELEVYQAHAKATRLLLTSVLSFPVAKKIEAYGWSERTLNMFGVGGVSSTADYLKAMVAAGYTREFLRQIDLDNPRIFSPHCLIYSVKDEHGRTVGFSARNLQYDAALAAAKRIAAEKGKDCPEFKAAREAIPAKFVNSTMRDEDGTVRNPIYQKHKRLLGIHTLKGAKTLFVVEGNADVVTAFYKGQKNVAGLCTNKLSKDHLELIFELGITNLVFVMDGDKGGEAGIAAFVKLMDENLVNRPGFNVQLIFMSGGADPDSYIREHGLNAFLDLERTSIFYWRMKQAMDAGDDSGDVAERGVGYIVNETEPIRRHGMLTQLANATGVPYEVLNRSVQDILSVTETRSTEQIAALGERLSQQLKKSPKNAVSIIEGAAVDLERMKTPTRGVTTQSILECVDTVFGNFETRTEEVGLKTGWPLFDRQFGGMPIGAAFVTMPGKANQGKTSVLCNLAVRTVDSNEDAIVLFHTVDDDLRMFLARICGIKYGYASKYFQFAGKYIKEDEQFRQVFFESKEWLREVIGAERFIPADVTMLPQTMNAYEAKIRSLRTAYPLPAHRGFWRQLPSLSGLHRESGRRGQDTQPVDGREENRQHL